LCFFFFFANDEKKKKKAAVVRFEEAVIEGGPIALPGAHALLSQIDAGSSPSAHGWTIVTSGTSPTSFCFPLAFIKENTTTAATNVLAPRALSRTNIPVPARAT
jgi:hypothetical protein